MRYILLVLLLPLFNISFAQQENLGDSLLHYSAVNNFEKAIFFGEKNISGFKAAGNTNDTLYATALNNLAFVYFRNGELKKAKQGYIDAADIFKANYGQLSKKYLFTKRSIADACQKVGEYDEAVMHNNVALDGYRKLNDTLNEDFASTISSLALIYKQAGKTQLAGPLYLQSLAIFEKAGLTGTHNYASTVNSTGAFYFATAKYKEAENYLQKGVQLYANIFGANNWDYGVAASNLAALYYQLGNYAAAADTFSRIQQVVKTQLTEKHPFYATVTGNLASIYYQLGWYEKAIPNMKWQLQINEKTFGKKSQEYAVPLQNLGNVYFRMKEFDTAIFYLQQAATIRKEAVGEKSILHAASLNSLALAFERKNNNPVADSIFKYALSILEQTAGKSHFEYLNVLNNYCEFLIKATRYKEALPLVMELGSTEKKLLADKLDFLSVNELQSYAFSKAIPFMQQAALLSYAYTPQLAAHVFDNALFLKGMGVQNFAAFSATMEQNTDSAISTLWKQYKETKAVLNKMLVLPTAQQNLKTDSLYKSANKTEKELLKKASAFNIVKTKLTFTWQQVKQQLKKQDAALEFVRYRILDATFNYEFRYGALLLRSADSFPLFVPLCSEEQLMASLSKFPYKNPQLISTEAKKAATRKPLYAVIWQPIEKLLLPVKNLYFSPDGLLHQVAFAALKTTNGTYIADRYQLKQLISVREISNDAEETPAKALLTGGIDYNKQQVNTTTPIINDAYAYVYRQNHRNVRDSFTALQYTLTEVNAVAAQLQQFKTQVYNYTGSQASESNLKAACISLQPSVIHFATHGFTLPDTTKILKIINPYTISKNPLLRTGLILAGGNTGWHNKTMLNEDDGILTGIEIAAMQLQHTQLVVLSACETANGEIKGNEGVFGLQRAFKMAGVKYVLASLWQVPDAETKDFMIQFYKNWVVQKNISTAFNTAQTYFRHKNIAPYYWAGFILVK